MSRENNIDILRLFLSFSVMYVHFIELTNSSIPYGIFKWFDGDFAVKSFFVLSGFLIWNSLVRAPSLKKYFLARFFRLYPALIITLILTVFISNVFFVRNIGESLGYLLWNLVLLNFVHPTIGDVVADNNINALNGSLWTLKIEVAYYIFLSFFFLKSRAKSLNIIYCITLVSVVAFCYIDYTGVLTKPWSNQFPFLFFYFGCGIVFYNLQQSFGAKPYLTLFLISFLLYLFFPGNVIFEFFTIIGFVFFVSFGTGCCKWFEKVGDMSYGIYIYHFPVIQFLIALGFLNNDSGYSSMICVFVFVVFISFLSWKFVEKNSIDFGKKLAGRKI